MQSKTKIYFTILICTFLFLFIFYSIEAFLYPFISKARSTSHEVNVTRSIPITKKYLPESTATIAGMGDVLIHGTLYRDALKPSGYDFKPMFAGVKPYMQRPDITIANQESIVGGKGLGLSTYPQFNSPEEVAYALADAGLDIVSMANNHTLDRGEQAILNATALYNKMGMPYVGAYRSQEDKNTIRLIEKNNITFAFLAYSYGTNGIRIPQNKDYLVSLINKENMINDIKHAKKQSDVVVVSIHFGNEYERMPNQTQKELVKVLVNEGADIIFGHHPHVLQPTEWITADDGRKAFVIYSLGNYLSGQNKPHQEIGAIVQLDVTKRNIDGNTSNIIVHNPQIKLTYVSKSGYHNYRIIPLTEAVKSGKVAMPLLKDVENHMKTWMPELKMMED